MLDLVINWREKRMVPDMIKGQRVVDGKTELDIPLYPYRRKPAGCLQPGSDLLTDPRGGVDRIAERFRPSAAGE